jgi:hypothetical protein
MARGGRTRITEELWHKALETTGTRIGFFSKMREAVALLVVSSWRNLFEILTFQVVLSQVTHGLPERTLAPETQDLPRSLLASSTSLERQLVAAKVLPVLWSKDPGSLLPADQPGTTRPRSAIATRSLHGLYTGANHLAQVN